MYSDEEFRESSRKSKRKNFKQLMSVTAAAVLGSAITAGVFAITLKPLAVTSGALSAAPTSTSASASGTAGAQVQSLSAGYNASNASTVTQVFQQDEKFVVAVVNYQNSTDQFTGQTSLKEYGIGSGVIIKRDSQYAYIVTNNHVVSGAAKLDIVLSTGKRVQATLVGADPYTDLAVIRVPVSSIGAITPATFADSSQIQPGQLAIAIGTPDGLDFRETVTSGIISGTNRTMPVQTPDGSGQVLDYQSVIQTDAAINPGNSGGPLLNAAGQVVGINSSKIVQQGFDNMGFAIPSNEVAQIVDEILSTGHVYHPALGITAYPLSAVPPQDVPNTPVTYGAYVYSVDSQSAKDAGLKVGDVIVALNGQAVKDTADLRTSLFAVKPGSTVSVTVYRGSERLTLHVKVTSLGTLK